ncbi:MAG: hypothetical protein AAFR61_02250 [Bacteroidota bacterium]
MRHTRGIFVLLLAIGLLPATMSAQISKEEKKFWKDKAKMYTKNPVALKAEFENYQEQIKDLKLRNKTLQGKVSNVQNSDVVDSLRWALIQMEGELQAARTQIEKLREVAKTQNVVLQEGIKTGLVYRVQIGAYVFHEMQGAPASDQQDFVAERADGFNKYLIGQFRTYQECEDFRNGLRKMGIADAWIVPYIDGVRVTIDEANRYRQNEGRTTFLND